MKKWKNWIKETNSFRKSIKVKKEMKSFGACLMNSLKIKRSKETKMRLITNWKFKKCSRQV